MRLHQEFIVWRIRLHKREYVSGHTDAEELLFTFEKSEAFHFSDEEFVQQNFAQKGFGYEVVTGKKSKK